MENIAIKRTTTNLFLLFALCVSLSQSQNLVPNPSFENPSSCPTGAGSSLINLTAPWFWPSSHTGSADIYNTCIGTTCTNGGTVPNNMHGTAQPFQGNGYAGIITCMVGNGNYREYIQVQLTSPLVANNTYCVSFRVLRGSRCRYAADKIGVHISTGPVTQAGNGAMTNFIPQIEGNTIIRDSLNWTLISGSYTAAGGEDYITIGNFRTDAGTNWINAGAGPAAGVAPCQSMIISTYTYYFIDNVSVEACILPPPVAGYRADSIICEGTCINYTDTSSGMPVSWNWSFEGASITSSTQQHPVNICYPTAGVYNTTLVASNANGSDVIIKTITVNAPQTFVQQAAICQGSNFVLPDGSVVNTTGVYNTTITASIGCDSIVTTQLTVNSLPEPAFIANNVTGCGPLCTDFINTTPATQSVQWDFGDGNTSTAATPTNCFTSEGEYTVTLYVTDNNGCTNTLTKTNLVIVHPNPIANFNINSNPSTENTDIVITDQSTGAAQWQWSFGDALTSTSTQQHPTVNYAVSGQYTIALIVTNSFGCRDTSEQLMVVESEFMFYVPNSFTPNGDNYNNTFFPLGAGVKQYEIWIYDRWGNLIWHSNSSNEQWDGTVMGSSVQVQEDVYVWKIKALDLSGKQHNYVGHVTLIK